MTTSKIVVSIVCLSRLYLAWSGGDFTTFWMELYTNATYFLMGSYWVNYLLADEIFVLVGYLKRETGLEVRLDSSFSLLVRKRDSLWLCLCMGFTELTIFIRSYY